MGRRAPRYIADRAAAVSDSFIQPWSRRLLVVFSVVMACLVLDQTTKAVARVVLSENESLLLMGGVVRLQLFFNGGGVWSIGDSLSSSLRTWLFVGANSVVLIGILVGVLFSRSPRTAEVLAAAILLGGGSGNVVDRFVRGGSVTDFISIGFGPYRAGIFNIADVLIVAAFLLVLVSATRNGIVRAASDNRLGSRT
jgi:signal peptidase II